MMSQREDGPPIGTVVDGRYEVVSKLGSGGMGQVYEVMHLGLRKPFALKCLNQAAQQDTQAVERFVQESRGLAAVVSDFVVAVCDSGQFDNGAPYFVMERLRGRDLRKHLLEPHSLTPLRVVRLMVDACLGVQAMHEAGLVHRDLKPENLFVVQDGDSTERCKVLDFGIAKTSSTHATKPQALLGTLKYMAPEQLSDPSAVDRAADVYSLGAIAYECLAGRPPHNADTEAELMFKVLNVNPAALGELVPTLEVGLGVVVTKALSRDPKRRYPSAVAFAGALTSCLVDQRDAGEASNEEPVRPHSPEAPRRRWNFVGALCTGLLLGTSLAWTLGRPLGDDRPTGPTLASAPAAAPPAVPSLPSILPEPSGGFPALQAPVHAPVGQVQPSKPRGTPVRPTLPSIDDRNPYQ